jgi:hypothetical protein
MHGENYSQATEAMPVANNTVMCDELNRRQETSSNNY